MRAAESEGSAIASSSLAFGGGAQPAFDPASARCTNVYCHGAGAKAAGDTSSLLHRDPLWTGGSSELTCGGCHGIPPVDGAHDASMSLGQCASCHPQSVDGNGDIVFTGSWAQRTSTHINGVIDVQK